LNRPAICPELPGNALPVELAVDEPEFVDVAL
jgi:hypothetical protein